MASLSKALNSLPALPTGRQAAGRLCYSSFLMPCHMAKPPPFLYAILYLFGYNPREENVGIDIATP